jgi:Mg2+ and Co2+ transporter CorA
MPELSMPYGYAIFWGICLALGAGLLLLFRRLGWLGGDD